MHKQWLVNGAPFPNTGQLDGLTAELSLTKPGTDDFTAQEWGGEPRGGFNASQFEPDLSTVSAIEDTAIADFLPGGCVLTERRIRMGGADLGNTGGTVTGPTENLLTDAPLVPPGLNEWTVTNVVECISTLTLSKTVANGPPPGFPGPVGTPGRRTERPPARLPARTARPAHRGPPRK